MLRFLLVLLVCAACQTTTNKDFVFPATKIEQLKPPLEDRTPLNGPERAVGVTKGTPAPFDGILLSERLMTKYKLIQKDRDTCRTERQIEQDLHVGRFKQCNDVATRAVKAASLSWWQQNKGWVGYLGGYISATVTSLVAVVLASQAKK